MEKRRRKRKIKIGRVLAFVIILILIIGIIIFFTSKGKNISIGKSSMYLAGDTNKVTTYIMDEDNSLVKKIVNLFAVRKLFILVKRLI